MYIACGPLKPHLVDQEKGADNKSKYCEKDYIYCIATVITT